MTEINDTKLVKAIDPFLADLPPHLQDRANFRKIQMALLETLATTHSHSDVFEWFKCFPCQQKALAHKEMMINLGFKSPVHYKAWHKIMETPSKRVKLRKYDE